MLYWIRFPFIRIAISFASGILVNSYVQLSPQLLLGPLISSLVIFCISRRYFTKSHFHKYNLFLSLSAFFVIFLLGSIYIHVRDISKSNNHLLQINDKIECYEAQVMDAPDTSGRYCKVLSEVKRIRSKGKWLHTEGKVLMFLPKPQFLTYGQSLLVFGEPQKISPPLNPDEFNYQQYMHVKGISHQHFIKPGMYTETYKGSRKSLVKGISLKIRDHLSGIIESSFQDRNTKALMLALMTGQRDYINEDLYNSFIDTGIIHVLAISGLHVGIIYMLLIFLLKPLNRKKWSTTLSYCLKIFILITFAFMTGLSPSVMRATLMFIVMIIGRILNRNTHILNSVFFSFFILLVLDPYKLFDVGFQLSYSAVIGIILFLPVFYNPNTFKLQFFNWVWQLTAVSISAQLGTLPFALYYFKQFPTYFLIGNLFAIPFVSVATILGFCLIITSFIPNLAYLIAVVLEFLSGVFHKLIFVLNSLPFGLIKPIQIERSQAIMMAVLFLSIYLMIRTRIWKFILVSMGCAIGIIGIDIMDKTNRYKEKHIIIYNTPNISSIELVDGNTSNLVVKDFSEFNTNKINYYVMNHIVSQKRKTEFTDYSGISEKIPAMYRDGYLLICWNGKTIAILKGDAGLKGFIEYHQDLMGLTGSRSDKDLSDFERYKDSTGSMNLNIDYVIISNIWQNSKDLQHMFNSKGNIIFDSSNHFDLENSQANYLYESLHVVPVHGPYIEKINY